MDTCRGPGHDRAGCGRPAVALGYCWAHYRAILRAEARGDKPALVPVKGRGSVRLPGLTVSQACAARLARVGPTLYEAARATLEAWAQAPWRVASAPRAATPRPASEGCSGPGPDGAPCDRPALYRGLCAAHYTSVWRARKRGDKPALSVIRTGPGASVPGLWITGACAAALARLGPTIYAAARAVLESWAARPARPAHKKREPSPRKTAKRK